MGESGSGKDLATMRVFVLGLDGATWDLLEPLLQDDLLPNLARLREQGALTLDLDPTRLTSAVLNQYLRVKERAML